MAWGQKVTDRLADYLRFTARAAMLVNGIVLALASVYVVAKICYFTLTWLDKVFFSKPW